MKGIVACCSRFPVKLIFSIAFDSASSAVVYLNLLLSSYLKTFFEIIVI